MDLEKVLTEKVEKTRVLRIEISEGEILSLMNCLPMAYDFESSDYKCSKFLRSILLKLEQGWEKGISKEIPKKSRPEKHHGGLNMFKGNYDGEFLNYGQFEIKKHIEFETSHHEILEVLNALPNIYSLDSSEYKTAVVLFDLGKKLRKAWFDFGNTMVLQNN